MSRHAFKVAITVTFSATVVGLSARSDGPPAAPEVSVLEYPDSPLRVTPAAVASAHTPATVIFSVTNTGTAGIRNFDVRVYAFRPKGLPIGFKGNRLIQVLRGGETHQAAVTLPKQWVLQPGGVMLITVLGVTFDDESRWRAPEDSVERAKAEALRLTSTQAPAP